MDKLYLLDEVQTKRYCEPLIHMFEKKACYDNVFKFIGEHLDKFRSNEWKIAYGFWYHNEGLWVRHCFILVGGRGVIDPTAALFSGRKSRYLVFSELDLDEYLELIETNDYTPDLESALMQKDLEFRKKLLDTHNIICLG